MFDTYITFRTITRAQRGSKLFTELGLRHQLARMPKSIAAQGCGYAIRLNQMEVEHAIQALKQSDIAFQRCYRQRGNGELEEVAL